MTSAPREPRKRSLFTLISDVPGLLSALVRDEIEQLKRELLSKAKQAGLGIGLIATAAGMLFFALGVFVSAGVLALAQVLPAWAAALIVGGVLVLIAAGLIAAGAAQVKKGSTGPTESITSIRKDLTAIKGTGKREGS